MIAGALALLLASAPAGMHGVAVRAGNIVYRSGDTLRPVTQGGGNSDPALAPDGHTIAYLHLDGTSPDTSGDRISLWIVDAATGRQRRLLAPSESPDPKRNLLGFEHPRFSLDGGFVYLDAAAWATSSAVHQVNVSTGRERFVIDGGLVGVIRNGLYRGYLLVGRHKYHPEPELGSYDPVDVQRPDARVMFTVPGSDKDEGEHSVPAWLRTNHWIAN